MKNEMKNILMFTAILLAMLSCSNGNEPINPETPTGGKEYLVSLGMSGEITSIEESELTKSASDDLYGIQVYSIPNGGGEYKPYAYGVFDDKSKMQVKLLEGYRYKFESTMIVNGKNLLYLYFYISGDSSYHAKIENYFKYTISRKALLDNASITWLSNGVAYKRPNIDRYYGQTVNYTPSDNGNVSIDMKRVVFGSKFITEGLTEGKIKIVLTGAPECVINFTDAKHEIESIFTFENPYPGGMLWAQDNYSEIIPVAISWEKADGAIIPLVSQNITFKRKKLTTITIKVADLSLNNGIGLNPEQGDLTPGDDIVIEAGNGSDTGVDPNI